MLFPSDVFPFFSKPLSVSGFSLRISGGATHFSEGQKKLATRISVSKPQSRSKYNSQISNLLGLKVKKFVIDIDQDEEIESEMHWITCIKIDFILPLTFLL